MLKTVYPNKITLLKLNEIHSDWITAYPQLIFYTEYPRFPFH